jgi:hypothetical protein
MAEDNLFEAVAFDRSSVIAADPEVVWCEMEGGAALLDLRSSTYFSINETGATLWTLLDRPRSFDDIRGEMLDRYDVDPSELDADLRAMLAEMATSGLVSVKHAGAA